MTALVKREELHAFSDGAALLGVAVCAVIGFAWAAAGRDPGIVLAGSILMIAAAMSGVYLLDRFRGKAPPVDETGYADGVIRAGVIATVFWGIAGFLVGDLIAWQLAYPILNLDLEWTSFGRLRPLHTSAVIFAFGGNALIASSFYVVQRTSRARLAGRWSPWFVFWGYQLFIVLAATGYLLGVTQSKEYAEPEWYVDLWLTLVWVVYFLVYVGTLARRREPHIYVANWFYLAFIVTIAMLHIINNLAIPVSLMGSKSYVLYSGVQDAMTQWWYGHFIGWMLLGASWQMGLTYAIAVLIITCPCALALAVPAVQIAAASRLLRRGIVIKAADGLERAAEADIVVFDKTGTLTLGRPLLLNDAEIPDDVLKSAAELTSVSKHPYAQAIVAAARNRNIVVAAPEGVEETPGRGLARALMQGEERLGSAEWCHIRAGVGTSEVWYARDWQAPVRFRFADALRPDAAETVQELKRRGYPVALLSGDRKGAVEVAAMACGITTWLGELTPAHKIDWLAKRAREGRKVLMVGDGLNDAPALAAAHASLSPASAADISQRAADFVFQGERLAPVLEALSTAKRARNLSLQNFGVAFCYNIVAVPFAMAGYVTPLIAAIVMSTSSILVTLNAARLAGGPKS